MNRFGMILAAAAVLICLCGGALAEQGWDITEYCAIRVSGYSGQKKDMLDTKNMTMWCQRERNAWIEVKPPEGIKASGVYLRWGMPPIDLQIEAPDKTSGEWQAVQQTPAGYYNQYIPFETPLAHFRIRPREEQAVFGLIKLQVLSPGDLPREIETWQPFEGKADLMVLVAHPDDELLFMGGVIPYYNTQMGKRVIVVYVARMNGFRLVEALDGLWHCGVRAYPEMPNQLFEDQAVTSLRKCLDIWREDRLLAYVTEMIRKYRPDVIVTHDVNGEYGHGAHRACCWAVQQCVETAADPDRYPESAAQYGAWQIKKAYIHLYRGELGQIDFDWRQPLSAFDGKTAFEITDEAFHLHKTQAFSGKYQVKDYGKYDNSLFGLYYSTVGPDTGANDLFEHLAQ